MLIAMTKWVLCKTGFLLAVRECFTCLTKSVMRNFNTRLSPDREKNGLTISKLSVPKALKPFAILLCL